jgi:hypothetical protein
MAQGNHPIEQEELMAYLDGELSPDRAAAAVAHLERCSECQRVAALLQDVSQNLMAWEVASSSPGTEAAAPKERAQDRPGSAAVGEETRRSLFGMRRFAPWALGFALVGLVVVVGLSMRTSRSKPAFPSVAYSVGDGEPAPGNAPQNGADRDRFERFAKLQRPPATPVSGENQLKLNQESVGRHLPLAASLEVGDRIPPLPNGPMIIRTASVTLTTKDFDRARAGLDDILKRHRGYVGQLTVNTPLGLGRTLTATLRVPADRLEATLVDLRKLGRVEAESQGGQEVTSQYVDLEARLSNNRNTERRLTELLQQRTGKLSDVLAVETEISRVRGEIEQMEAERKNLANQVDFATLSATVNEDYKAQLQVVPPSTSTQFRNAAVDGYRSMVDGIVGVAVFLVSYGPTLLFWAGVLFFPVRILWRKVRSKLA